MPVPSCAARCREVLVVLLTVISCTAASAQSSTRVARTTDLNSPNRLPGNDDFLRTAPVGGRDSLLYGDSNVDLDKVDRTALANLLKEAIAESESLYRQLDKDSLRNPALTPLMRELLSLRNLARQLSTDIAARVPLEEIIVDFRALDSDWRLLSNRLIQSRLTQDGQISVDRLDKIDQAIGKLFHVAPTLDRRALLEETSAMKSAFRSLIDELNLDTEGGNAIDQMILDSRRLQQQVGRVEQVVLDNRSEYDEIVNEYSRFTRVWTSLLTQLRKLPGRRIERQVQYLVASNNNILQLLWMDNTSDKDQLQQTAERLMRTVDEFYNRTPLKLLLNVRDVPRAIQTANDFYGTVENFRDLVVRDQSSADIVAAYRDVEEYGYAFTKTFDQMNSQTARVVLRQIEEGIYALRNELNMAGTVSQVDYTNLQPITASLDNLADQLDYDVRLWLKSDRLASSTEALRASQAFMTRARRMHSMAARQPSLRDLQSETNSLIDEWLKLLTFLRQCNVNSPHRPVLSRTAGEIQRDITDLQTLVQL